MSKHFLALFLLCIANAPAGAAPARNEELASRFLYCANVNQFWYQYLAKNDPNSAGIDGYRESANLFRLAATIVTDGDYVAEGRGAALKKVIDVLEKEKRDGIDLMGPESKSCLDTFQNEATPILKAGRKQKE